MRTREPLGENNSRNFTLFLLKIHFSIFSIPIKICNVADNLISQSHILTYKNMCMHAHALYTSLALLYTACYVLCAVCYALFLVNSAGPMLLETREEMKESF